jgi:hypothetical protein
LLSVERLVVWVAVWVLLGDGRGVFGRTLARDDLHVIKDSP